MSPSIYCQLLTIILLLSSYYSVLIIKSNFKLSEVFSASKNKMDVSVIIRSLLFVNFGEFWPDMRIYFGRYWCDPGGCVQDSGCGPGCCSAVTRGVWCECRGYQPAHIEAIGSRGHYPVCVQDPLYGDRRGGLATVWCWVWGHSFNHWE